MARLPENHYPDEIIVEQSGLTWFICRCGQATAARHTLTDAVAMYAIHATEVARDEDRARLAG